MVVASGNDGLDAPSLLMPAVDPHVLAVGAVDHAGTERTNDDVVAEFTNGGSDERRSDVLAPGKSVVSLRVPGGYADVAHPEGRVAGDTSARFFRGSGTSQAAAVIAAVTGLGLQFDIYHCQVSEGDIVRRMEALLPIIGHMQVADVPDRHEPGTGEIGWAHVFARMDSLGYAGWVGCEYRPAGETLAGLAAWRGKFGI